MKKVKSILAVLIALCMLMPSVVLPVSAAETAEATGAVDAMEAISSAFDDTYLIESHKKADDGYIGIPVDVHIYYTKTATAKAGYRGTPLMIYVVNTNTERIGTESDVAIMTRWLEKGWIVAVLDYKNNVGAVSPGLECSVQRIRNKLMLKGNYLTASNFPSGTYWDNYVLPAGYDIRINDVFWEVDKHSSAGTMQEIVDVWNEDLKGARPDVYLNWTYKDENGKTVRKEVTEDAVWYKDKSGNVDMENGIYTKVRYTVVNDISDCSNPDGTPVDLDLYMTFMYPTKIDHEVPVMAYHNSTGYMPETLMKEGREQFLGCIFNGYAGVIWDYLYVPFMRSDAVSFTAGSDPGGYTGDAVSYSADLYNDKKINTAAMRYIRYVTLSEPETFKFDTDKIGTIGISKSGTHPFLGEAILREPLIAEEEAKGLTTEQLEEKINDKICSFTSMRILPGHNDESRYQNGELESYTAENGVTIEGGELQPWLTYNGKELLSGCHFVYCSCPNCEEDITEGHAPTFIGIQLQDGYWTRDYGTTAAYINLCRTLNIPSVWVAVELGHTLSTGPDVTTNIDTYNAFRSFADYYLKETPVEVLYTLPLDKSLDVGVTSDIIIKFAGEVYADEIEKITIKSESGDVLTGSWTSLFGNTEWTFKPDKAMKPGERYTVTAPASLKGSNGKEMGKAYTSSFVTEAESVINAAVDGFQITATVPDIEEASKDGYINDMKLRFYVPTEGAANTAEVYAEGKLLGSVSLKGKGHYSLDISDYLETKNAGDAVTFTIKQAKTAGVFDHYEETYNSGTGDTQKFSYAGWGTTSFDGRNALKVWIPIENCMYKLNPCYMNLTEIIKNNKIIDNGKILTAEDYGRRFTISVDIYDSVSRRLMMYTESCDAPKTYRTLDTQRPHYNFTTEAGEWKTFSFDYTVYDSEFGKAGAHAQMLTMLLAPDGVNETPIYIDNIKVTETVTDFEIEAAEISAFSEGSYSYKAAEGNKPFALYSGEELIGEYDSWKAVLSAYSEGSTIKLLRNYVFTDADTFSSFDSFESVDIDMNGYVIYSENENNSLLWLKTTKTGNTALNIANGTVFLKNTPLVSYASSTTAGSGKEYDINLDNVNIILNEDFVAYNIMSDKAITNGCNVKTDITLTDCTVEADNDAMETWDVTMFPSGDGSLTTNYSLRGGSIKLDSFKKLAIYDSVENTTFCADEKGMYTTLSVPANVIVEEASYKTDKGYKNFLTNDTGDGRYTYTLEKTELSTLYGIIPTEYADKELFPLAVFNANGEFMMATDNYGNGNASAMQNAKNAGDGAVVLLRRDFDLAETGTFANLSQVNTTLYIDLNGFEMNMVNNAYFLNAEAKTNHDTKIIVKNGTLRTKKNPFVRYASWAATAYTAVKNFNITFENVTFGFSEGVSGLTKLISTSYTDGDDPLVNASLNLNNCTIDLETNAPKSAYTLFYGLDALNHIPLKIDIKGGKIIADSLEYATLSSLNAAIGSSLTLSKDAEGRYPALLVKNTDNLFGDVVNTSEDGYKVYSSPDEANADGYYECTLDGDIIVTEYGAVSPEYAEKTFVAFSGGKSIFAHDEFYGANNTGIFHLAKEYLKGNVMNPDGSTGANAQEVQIVMMKDYTMGNVNYTNIAQLKGRLTIDLNGKTFTQANSKPIFSAHAKPWGTYGVFETDITMKNGNIVLTNSNIFRYQTWRSTYTGTNKKHYVFNFEDIAFSLAEGSTVGTLAYYDKAQDDLPAVYDVNFVNCDFDLTNATKNVTLFHANHEANDDIRVNYSVEGGNITASKMSYLTMSKLGESNSSIVYKPSEGSGLYTTITLPKAATAPSLDIASGDNTLSYEKYADNADGSVTYAPGVVTEYGVIPPQYAGKTFIIFSDGAFKYATDILYHSSDNDNALYLVKEKILKNNKVNTDGSIGSGAKEAQVVMTKDYTVPNTAFENIAQIRGRMTLDLDGHKLTQYGSQPIFALQAKPWTTVSDTNILVKNGTMEIKNGAIIQYYTWRGSSYTGKAAKRYILDFEDISFAVTGSAENLVAYNTKDNKNLAADYDISFTDCTFDLTKASKNFTLMSASHDINADNPITVDYKLTGGEIVAKTADSFTLSSFTGTGAATVELLEKDGLYTVLTLPENAQAPSGTVDVNGTQMLYTKASEGDGNVTYKLVPAEYAVLSYDAEKKSAEIMIEKDGTYVILFAQYEGDKLVGINMITKTLTEGVQTVEQTLDFTANKVMLWQDIKNMVPLC